MIQAGLRDSLRQFDDLKTVAVDQLQRLVAEIRRELLTLVPADRGAPLAEPGGIELLVALSRVFQDPHDRIVWELGGAADVGKASRQLSVRFDAPHVPEAASLANAGSRPLLPWPTFAGEGGGLTTALGLASAGKNLGRTQWVVAVVDEQALEKRDAGRTLAALEGTSRFLLVVREDDGSPQTRAEVSGDRRPFRFRSALEHRGFNCLPEVDATDLDALLEVLQQARNADVSAVLYLRTRPRPGGASWDQDCRISGEQLSSLLSDSSRRRDLEQLSDDRLHEAIDRELVTRARRDVRLSVVSLIPALRLPRFAAEFPERLVHASHSESEVLTWCSGLAAGGCRPVILLTPSLLFRHFEQIAEQFCAAELPATFVVTAGEATGIRRSSEWATTQSIVTFLRMLPNLTLMAPKDESEWQQMLGLSLDEERPAAIRLPRSFEDATSSAYRAECFAGRAEVLLEGREFVLMTVGELVSPALDAAVRLTQGGCSTGVVNLRFLQPLDEVLLQRLTGESVNLVTLDEGASQGGVGTAVLDVLAEADLRPAVTAIGNLSRRPEEDPATGRRRIVDLIVARVSEVLATRRSKVPVPETPRRSQRRIDGREPRLKLHFSPEVLQQERRLICEKQLSPTLERWITEYEQVGHRSRYLWQWCQQGVELTTFPSVAPELWADACDTKVLSIILNVLLDDVADRHGSCALLSELLAVTQSREPQLDRFDTAERAYLELAGRVWQEYWNRTRRYPCFAVFEELLRYDLSQLFNFIRYSSLLNGNLQLLNVVEHDLYSPHSMMQISFATVDLMCSPDFQLNELGKIREIAWHVQWMGRIGNLITTWQREIGDGDFTSGVFARAVVRGDLSIEQLNLGSAEEIETAIREGGHEEYFLRKWEYHHRCLNAMRSQIRSFDLGVVIRGLERLLFTELGSRGLK